MQECNPLTGDIVTAVLTLKNYGVFFVWTLPGCQVKISQTKNSYSPPMLDTLRAVTPVNVTNGVRIMLPQNSIIDNDGPLPEGDNRLVEKIIDSAKQLEYAVTHYSGSEVADQQDKILCEFWRWIIKDYFKYVEGTASPKIDANQ